jgi:hypothetical protein
MYFTSLKKKVNFLYQKSSMAWLLQVYIVTCFVFLVYNQVQFCVANLKNSKDPGQPLLYHYVGLRVHKGKLNWSKGTQGEKKNVLKYQIADQVFL